MNFTLSASNSVIVGGLGPHTPGSRTAFVKEIKARIEITDLIIVDVCSLGQNADCGGSYGNSDFI